MAREESERLDVASGTIMLLSLMPAIAEYRDDFNESVSKKCGSDRIHIYHPQVQSELPRHVYVYMAGQVRHRLVIAPSPIQRPNHTKVKPRT